MKVEVSQGELLECGAGLLVVGLLRGRRRCRRRSRRLAGAGAARRASRSVSCCVRDGVPAGARRRPRRARGGRGRATARRRRAGGEGGDAAGGRIAGLGAARGRRTTSRRRRWSPGRSSAPTASTASSPIGRPAPPPVESLTLLAPGGVAAAAEMARVCAEAQNRARDLQSTPANVATPELPRRAGGGDRRRLRRDHRRGARAASRSTPRGWAAWSRSARAAASRRG